MFAVATAPLDDAPVVVIIVNWNGRDWLAQCLPALAAQTYQAFGVIVVDNASEDDSVAWLRAEWPQVRVLALPENKGFAIANNVAIQASTAETIVLLNNDTRAEPGWLAAMLRAADDPRTGMVAPQIVRWDRPDLLDSAGIEVDWAGVAWNRGWGEPAARAAEAAFVFGPSGAAALYKRAMLDDIGLLDEEFFFYYEDVDLAWRAQRAGWLCRYAPDARVAHWHSATATAVARFKATMLGRNKWWAILKNYRCPALLWALPLILVVDLGAVVAGLVRDRNLAAVDGRVAAWRGARAMWRKRTSDRVTVALARPWPLRRL